ncbi:histidine kinase [Paenibacillus sp. LHD-38]|uniref:sensor histidine kinase n=1 Tax=Paenibacillus sp. LHD-38 TaxID=3072143 RepID=UPI00280E8C5E|nr:histidine kinase [Paenibacillus sp. LHD-38]MDQ8734790.1 histidine kinase [Paenibacillus sp. LHD-38]
MSTDQMNKKQSLRSKIILFDIATTLIPLILCTFLLITLIFNVLTDYIRNDTVFFLKQTNTNFQSKTELLEDTLLRFRNNAVITDYLTNAAGKAGEAVTIGTADNDLYAQVETQFELSANLYSDKNTVKLEQPFLDKIYLFDNNGVAFNAFYYQPLKSLMKEFDKKYTAMYKEFFQSTKEVSFVIEEDHIHLLFPLYSDSMQSIGTIIFVINQSSVHEIMQDIGNYNDSFWFMFDGQGELILSNHSDKVSPDEERQIIYTYQQDAYEKMIGTKEYLVYTERMNMDFNSVIAIPSNQLSTLLFNSIKAYVYVFILIIVLVILFTIFFINRITRPLKEVASSMRLVSKGRFEIKMPEFKSREFAHVSEVFNTMMDRINYLIQDVYKKQLIIKESELKFLQTQVNPHFMFNVLNTISLKAKMDNNDEVSRMISSFAGLIQASIFRTGKEKVKIKEELIYVEFYLYLQSYRFEDKLTYRIIFEDENLLELYVPKLAIQFLVENAVMHGIEPKPGEGFVEVYIHAKNDRLFIDVKDNGIGFQNMEGKVELPFKTVDHKKGHNHVGLNNAYKIIQYFYGQDYGIHIYTKKDEGTTATIQIPFDRKDPKMEEENNV